MLAVLLDKALVSNIFCAGNLLFKASSQSITEGLITMSSGMDDWSDTPQIFYVDAAKHFNYRRIILDTINVAKAIEINGKTQLEERLAGDHVKLEQLVSTKDPEKKNFWF